MSSTGSLRKSKSKVSKTVPKSFTFNKANVEQTSRMPLATRDYGFLKTTNTATPFPKKADPLNTQMLVERLQGAVASSIVSDTDPTSTLSQRHSDYAIYQSPRSSEEISFEMKRKLFHEGEFTITKGKKTSEMYHPTPDFEDLPKGSKKDSQLWALKAMESYCRNMNIKFSKGFEN
ncbi:uncharacterized protein LOC132786774 [Drosophila nasuta]|uniref:uncharacterized protein LOC132786774 n=1 Tax=Drosophila nasuta TaxID=42062 RepID=UPI00295F2853|nr:uncharacterized protein LOC132786774 [Drosophila nasuta]